MIQACKVARTRTAACTHKQTQVGRRIHTLTHTYAHTHTHTHVRTYTHRDTHRMHTFFIRTKSFVHVMTAERLDLLIGYNSASRIRADTGTRTHACTSRLSISNIRYCLFGSCNQTTHVRHHDELDPRYK